MAGLIGFVCTVAFIGIFGGLCLLAGQDIRWRNHNDDEGEL